MSMRDPRKSVGAAMAPIAIDLTDIKYGEVDVARIAKKGWPCLAKVTSNCYENVGGPVCSSCAPHVSFDMFEACKAVHNDYYCRCSEDVIEAMAYGSGVICVEPGCIQVCGKNVGQFKVGWKCKRYIERGRCYETWPVGQEVLVPADLRRIDAVVALRPFMYPDSDPERIFLDPRVKQEFAVLGGVKPRPLVPRPPARPPPRSVASGSGGHGKNSDEERKVVEDEDEALINSQVSQVDHEAAQAAAAADTERKRLYAAAANDLDMITNSENAIQTHSFTIRNAVKRLRLHLRKLEEGDVVSEEDLTLYEEL